MTIYIFLDESGDLGFDFLKSKTSENFTITLLVCDGEETHKAIQKAVKKTLKRKINSSNKKRIVYELKGSDTHLNIKRYFLNVMPESGWGIYTITVNKKRIFDQLKTKMAKNKLYNFLTKQLFIAFRSTKNTENVSLVVDKSKNNAARKDFNAYIRTHIENTFSLDTQIYITHENSQNNLGLQAVDMFCWGIQRKENSGDDEWYRLFDSKIVNHIRYLE